MSTPGTYTEKLPCGGTLKVTPGHWEIEYYFSGPDMRYNGTFVHVSDSKVEAYIHAFTENWEEYKKLKDSIPAGGTFSKRGKEGMMIHIGGFANGVCIESYHKPLTTPD